LFGLGDWMCQFLVEKKGWEAGTKYDYFRTARMSMIGGIIAGPCLYGWLNFALPRICGLPYVRDMSHWPQTFVCLGFDQTIWAYSFNAFMLFLLHFCDHFDPKAAWDHQRSLMWQVICSNWTIWPAVQLINLGILPPLYRLPVVNVVATGWNVYLSWKNQQGQKIKKADELTKDAHEDCGHWQKEKI